MSVLPFNLKHTASAATGSGRDHHSGLRPRQMVAGLSALSLAAVLAFAGPAGAAAGDPAGNNGTVKVDGRVFDDTPNNEPHPGCDFEVDFYGFDEGADLNATVTFAVHNETRGDDVLETHPDVVFIGEDANDGGGSEAGLDASQYYNLHEALSDGGYEPGRMGYHIKLTVHADGSIGADTKYKVFWVTDCVPPVVPPVDADDETDEYGDDDDIIVDGADDEIIDEGDDEGVIDEGDDEGVIVESDDDEIVTEEEDDTLVKSVVIPQVTGTTNGPGLTTLPAVAPVEVMGLLVVAGPAVPEAAVSGAGAATSTNDTLVLGETLARPDASAAPGALARTGSAVLPSLVLAAGLLMIGTVARRFGRAQTATQQ